MQLISDFWDAAVVLDRPPRPPHEGIRFGFCRPASSARSRRNAGLEASTSSRSGPARPRRFDDYWTPFLSGTGPAPAYGMSLGGEHRTTVLREALGTGCPPPPTARSTSWPARGHARNPSLTPGTVLGLDVSSTAAPRGDL